MQEIIATIKIDIRKAKRKHRQHTSGAGQHDNRPKRQRTRQTQRTFALENH